MTLSSTALCMEQIIKADQEASEPTPTEQIEYLCPQLPSKEETIVTFMEAAVAVSQMGRYNVASSGQFKTMKDSHAAVKALNKGDKEQTKKDLFDGYCSDDEKYYTDGLEDTQKTVQRIKALDSLLNQPMLAEHQKRSQELKQKQEHITKTIQVLLEEKTAVKEALRKHQEEGHIETVCTILSNNKEQENSLLRTRRETLLEKIQAVDERIKKSQDNSNAALEADVTQSMMESAVTSSKETEKKLLEEKTQLQEKLDALDSFIAQVSETPKSGWFGFW